MPLPKLERPVQEGLSASEPLEKRDAHGLTPLCVMGMSDTSVSLCVKTTFCASSSLQQKHKQQCRTDV